MKKLALLFLVHFFCSAQSQTVLSLNPIFNEQDAVLIPKVEGSWKVPDLNLLVAINKKGDNFYSLQYGDSSSFSRFEALFIRVKNEIILDLSGVMKHTGDDAYTNSFIKCHSLYKVFVSEDSLALSELNYNWFYDYASKKQSPLKYEWSDNGMLLTLKPFELKSFFEEHVDKGIFKEFVALRKVHPADVTSTIINSIPTNAGFINANIQQCKPTFPFKDGWLGGDGDVSVAINSSTTIFIFSDTWIGRKNQQSRLEPGIGMVANSVAVERCLTSAKMDVQYFWNNMYSDHPEPFFKSFTDRYKYWIIDAFMIRNNLYVVLQKTGQKKAVAPDDMFPFSILGYSIAKVTNPQNAPDQWHIQLKPVYELNYPELAIQSHVIMDNHIYFFVSRNDKALALVRKHFDAFDDPEKPYEYLALDKTWKEGIVTNDMHHLVEGFRCNTVNYHPDIKQWIMICDVKFMDNKIKMRTAPLITGPWSQEKTVYEIPEVTAGSLMYDNKNFSYLPRECIQYYDPKKHEMLLTYDVNNSNFSYLNTHPEIYTPKVITIRLMQYLKK